MLNLELYNYTGGDFIFKFNFKYFSFYCNSEKTFLYILSECILRNNNFGETNFLIRLYRGLVLDDIASEKEFEKFVKELKNENR